MPGARAAPRINGGGVRGSGGVSRVGGGARGKLPHGGDSGGEPRTQAVLYTRAYIHVHTRIYLHVHTQYTLNHIL